MICYSLDLLFIASISLFSRSFHILPISNSTAYLSDSNVGSIGDFHAHVVDRPLLCIQRFCNDNCPNTLLCIKRAVKIPP